MKTRRITLIVAIVLAVGTGILTLKYLSSVNDQAKAREAAATLRPIIVASRDIPARAIITPAMVSKSMRATSEVDPLALSDARQAVGSIALATITAGTTITQTKIGQPDEAGVTARLRPGMRAVSIPVDRVKAVSNLIQPGDRVDVMADVSKGPGVPPKTFTIIRGALVLAINALLEPTGSTATPAPDAGGAATITLGVTPQQADLLTVADLNTTLRLALRSPQEPVRSLPAEKLQFSDLGNTQQASTGSTPGNVPPPASPAPAPMPSTNPVPAPAPSVTVIDGDRVIAGLR